MEERDADLTIEGYIDHLKEARSLAAKNNLFKGLLLGIESIIDDMDALKPFLQTKTRRKRLKADAEKFMANLLESCRDGNEAMSLGNMRQLRDRVAALKVLFSRDE